MDFGAAEHGELHGRAVDVARFDLDDVLIEHDEVRELADLDRTGRVGVAERIRGDDVVHMFWLFVNVTTGALLSESVALARPQSAEPTPADAAECRALAEYGARIAACDYDAEFERSIDTFISLVDSARIAA